MSFADPRKGTCFHSWLAGIVLQSFSCPKDPVSPCWPRKSKLCQQVGKEHLGLKAVTEVLQDLQYKVWVRADQMPYWTRESDNENLWYTFWWFSEILFTYTCTVYDDDDFKTSFFEMIIYNLLFFWVVFFPPQQGKGKIIPCFNPNTLLPGKINVQNHIWDGGAGTITSY